MAYRDRSQGFGFVYVNLAEILKARDEGTDLEAQHKPDSPTAKVNFPNIESNFDLIKPVIPAQKPAAAPQPSVAEIRENLDRLQKLHRKLHVILEELGQVTGKKKTKE